MPPRAFEKLLQPGQIGKLKTRNRIVRTAAGVDYLNKDFTVVEEKMLPLYEAWARGGAGLIILGGANAQSAFIACSDRSTERTRYSPAALWSLCRGVIRPSLWSAGCRS